VAQGTSKGPWIIVAAIVLVGILIVFALILLLRPSGEGGGGTSPAVTPASPSPADSSPSPEKKHTRSPKPPKPSPSPAPSPPPAVDNTLLVREAAQKAAESDRPGEVKHVGNVEFFKDPGCSTREGASANVRYETSPKLGVWLLCKQGSKWKINQGPIYGE